MVGEAERKQIAIDRARERKALAIEDVLARAGCDAETARRMPDETWNLAAAASGQRPPSAVTRDLIIRMLETRRDVQCAEPFAIVARLGSYYDARRSRRTAPIA